MAGEEVGLVTDPSQGEPVNSFPLSFRWSNAEPFQGPGFDSLLASIKAGTAADNKLEITGLYFEEESAPADVETMGLARAVATGPPHPVGPCHSKPCTRRSTAW